MKFELHISKETEERFKKLLNNTQREYRTLKLHSLLVELDWGTPLTIGDEAGEMLTKALQSSLELERERNVDLQIEVKAQQALLAAAMEDANRWRQCEAQGLFPEQHLLGERTPLWIYNLGGMNKFMETASEAFDAAMTKQAISQINEG